MASFGGWLLSQMDVGGGVFASRIAKSRNEARVRIEFLKVALAIAIVILVGMVAAAIQDLLCDQQSRSRDG
jgi:acyl-CoA thioesterase YciA